MWVPEELRGLYHAGLAHGANHLVTLVSQAMELLERRRCRRPGRHPAAAAAGRARQRARRRRRALTGPIVRGDVNTVRAHLAEIAAHGARHAAVVRRARPGHPRPRGDRRPGAADPRGGHPAGARRGRAVRLPTRPAVRRCDDPRAPARVDARGARRRAGAAPACGRDRRRSSPTMGALHEGHASLFRTARERVGRRAGGGDSIFVNPLQFGAGEDLDRYPRTFEADLAICAREGVDVVFAPTVAEVYPDGEPQVTVEPGPLAAELEGASRPGHFRGVLTVVAKLFGLVRPDLAVFGEKDYQQLVLVRRMSRTCAWASSRGRGDRPRARRPGAVEPQPLPRPGGPAPRGRAQPGAARGAGPRAVRPAARRAGPPCACSTRCRSPSSSSTTSRSGRRSSPRSPSPIRASRCAARILVAARVGTTRLIDNLPLTLGGSTSPRVPRPALSVASCRDPHPRRPGMTGRRTAGRLAAPEPGWSVEADVVVIGLGHRRPDRGAAAARPRRPGAGRHQGRARRGLDPVGAGRHRRRARSGGHPGPARARHARGRCGRVRRGGRAGAGDRGPAGRARADRARRELRPAPRRRAQPDPRGRTPPRPDRARRWRRDRRRDPAGADRGRRAGAGDRGDRARTRGRPAARRRRRRRRR